MFNSLRGEGLQFLGLYLLIYLGNIEVNPWKLEILTRNNLLNRIVGDTVQGSIIRTIPIFSLEMENRKKSLFVLMISQRHLNVHKRY